MSVQLIASSPENSAKVSANAGTGKTEVLSRRVLRLMLENVHPSKILCLTYTKAAAAEMVERVSKVLRNWAVSNDADLAKNIELLTGAEATPKQIAKARELFTLTLESTPPPRIQTIHSFCQEILRRFPLEAGLAPNFEVIDDRTSLELMTEAKNRLLQKSQMEPVIAEAVDFITSNSSEKKFGDITKDIISSRNRIRESAEPVRPLHNAAQLTRSFMEAKRTDNLVTALAAALATSEKATDSKHAALLKTGAYDDYYSVFMTDKGTPRARIATAEVMKKLPGADDLIARLFTELAEFNANLLEVMTAEFTYYTYHLAKGLMEIYDNLKSNGAWLDYNDLLFYTKKLLTTSGFTAWVLYKLDASIEHIMVDEAQDTSPEQWEIITALTQEFYAGEGRASAERTVFIVGDEKQSIYSFQGAEPAAFARFTKNIAAKVSAAGQKWHDLPLNTSYRSTSPVLQVVDEVFASHLSAINPEAKEISHKLHRIGHAGRVELWPIIKRPPKPEHENWHLPTEYFRQEKEQTMLAGKIAATIKDWLENKRLLPSKGRAVRASDILIIMRRRGDLADLVIKKLKEAGIAVSGADRLKLGEHIAVEDLVALGKFLLLPQDDLNLATLLKCPLFGVNEQELFDYCHGRKASLWDNLPQALKAELTDIFNRADYLSVYELYSYVLDVMGGRRKFIARLGYEVNDVLDEFLQLAMEFEQNHANSLQKFLRWLSLSGTEIKRDMEQNHEQVRVMTVHASKGLQAPIVFIADSTYSDVRSEYGLLWDGERFLATQNAASASNKYRELKTLKDADGYNEYLRLLYVAITRAGDELYICGTEGDRGISDDCWYRLVEPVMEKIAQKNADGSYVLETPQSAEAKGDAGKETEKPASIMPVFGKVAADEKISISNKLEQTFDVAAAERGRRIHKQLEYDNNLFPGAAVEVPVIGIINGEVLHRRIDRLLETGNEVQIIDFKTSEDVPNSVPAAYKEQLREYEQLVGLIIQGKTIRKFIYWTAANRLDEVV